MVVQGLIALALAAPTGGLFGLAYGTAIRVGYEIIYPLLFQDIAIKQQTIGRNKVSTLTPGKSSTTPAQIADILKGLTEMYTTVGGLEANAFGINTGIKNAMQAIQDDPELVELLKKNSNLLGQNITVNLSGTGLIGPGGQVVSDPVNLDLDPIEKIQAEVDVTIHQQKAADDACRREYGPVFSVAGFDQNNKQVSCMKIVGGQVVSRRPWPPLEETEQALDIQVEFGNSTLTYPDRPINAPKAGQTQRLARDQLIRDIEGFRLQIKKTPAVGTHKAFRQSLISKMVVLQQNLVNLLQRYRW